MFWSAIDIAYSDNSGGHGILGQIIIISNYHYIKYLTHDIIHYNQLSLYPITQIITNYHNIQ